MHHIRIIADTDRDTTINYSWIGNYYEMILHMITHRHYAKRFFMNIKQYIDVVSGFVCAIKFLDNVY